MEIQKSSGIVLSSTSFGEADKIAIIFTKNYGKQKFIFKGLRKSKRRSITVSEPGTITNLQYYFHENRNSFIVNEFDIYKQYYDIRNDLKKIITLYYLLEIVEKTTGYNDKNKPIFNLIAAGIDTLSKTEYSFHLAVFFTLHLLELHGILPNLLQCKKCKRSDYNSFSLDHSDFLPICNKCMISIKNKILFSNKIKEFILQTMNCKFISIEKAIFPEKEIKNLLLYLTQFIESYFHIKIKSKSILFAD